MGKDLSDNQVSSMKEAFTLFDTDGDGRIAPSELGILITISGGNFDPSPVKSIIVEEKLTRALRFPSILGPHG
uniref:EF-hand domain-containing protein n=1 Tax=Cannabis sativa TaxID=3483 RepID=A0A803Q699_CANSA